MGGRVGATRCRVGATPYVLFYFSAVHRRQESRDGYPNETTTDRNGRLQWRALRQGHRLRLRILARYPCCVSTTSRTNDPCSPSESREGSSHLDGNDHVLPAGHQSALELLPGEFTGALQRAEVTIVEDGGFIVPVRVDRRPISYDLLAYFLHELGELPLATDDNLAMAFGLRAEDVGRATTAWRRHLDRAGVPCPGCGAPMDPAFGAKCSMTCTGPQKPSRSRHRRASSSSRAAARSDERRTS